MSALQKKYFGKGRGRKSTVRKASTRKTSSAKKVSSSKGKKSKKFLGLSMPLTLKDASIDFIAGAISGPISDRTKGLQTKYLGSLGRYTDEGAWAILGTVGYSFGGKLHPMVKQASKELFRVAVISSGQQSGTQIVNSVFSGFKGFGGQGNKTASQQTQPIG